MYESILTWPSHEGIQVEYRNNFDFERTQHSRHNYDFVLLIEIQAGM